MASRIVRPGVFSIVRAPRYPAVDVLSIENICHTASSQLACQTRERASFKTVIAKYNFADEPISRATQTPEPTIYNHTSTEVSNFANDTLRKTTTEFYPANAGDMTHQTCITAGTAINYVSLLNKLRSSTHHPTNTNQTRVHYMRRTASSALSGTLCISGRNPGLRRAHSTNRSARSNESLHGPGAHDLPHLFGIEFKRLMSHNRAGDVPKPPPPDTSAPQLHTSRGQDEAASRKEKGHTDEDECLRGSSADAASQEPEIGEAPKEKAVADQTEGAGSAGPAVRVAAKYIKGKDELGDFLIEKKIIADTQTILLTRGFKLPAVLRMDDAVAQVILVAERLGDMDSVVEFFSFHTGLKDAAFNFGHLVIRREVLTGTFLYLNYRPTGGVLNALNNSTRIGFHNELQKITGKLDTYLHEQQKPVADHNDPHMTDLMHVDVFELLEMLSFHNPEEGLGSLNDSVHGASLLDVLRCAAHYQKKYLQTINEHYEGKATRTVVGSFVKLIFHILFYHNIQTPEKAAAATRVMQVVLSSPAETRLSTVKAELTLLFPGGGDGSPSYEAPFSFKEWVIGLRHRREGEGIDGVRGFLRETKKYADEEEDRNLNKTLKLIGKKYVLASEYEKEVERSRENSEGVLRRLEETERQWADVQKQLMQLVQEKKEAAEAAATEATVREPGREGGETEQREPEEKKNK